LGNKDKVLFSQADVSNREQVQSMFDNAINKFGRVDILLNFAGINRDAPFTEITDDMWDSVIAAHLKGHFICGQEYVAHNLDREGLILNIGAAGGQMGRKNGANFCSAKGAIFALTKCMALELAPRIRVNCLVPGSVKTREVIDRYDLETDDGLEKELATLPMGRLGEFEDIIHMVQSIIDAKFTTGANFYANGGQYMH
jgi:NAD(P)-dependent dehydrogenase (short-subunit alcohol dehydrogenase family)